MVHLLWISSSGGYIHLVVQREQGRIHPLWIFACKGFYKVEKKSQGPQVAWGLDVGTGCCRTSIKFLCLFSSSLYSLISVVHFSLSLLLLVKFQLLFFTFLTFSKSLIKSSDVKKDTF